VLGLIGKKVGITQVFDEDENLTTITVIQAGPCPVVQVKTEKTDGYSAVKVAFDETKAHRITKPAAGIFANAGVGPHRVMKEFRLDGEAEHGVGDVLNVEVFESGEAIDVSARSKGRGFAGVVKRHGFKGGPKTHGQSDRHRAPGSIGQSSTPSRVIKGMRMPGHMGDRNVTVRGLTVFGVDSDKNLLLVRGSIPGSRGATVVIHKRSA
jgi:large subunit ribosomal protein L3